MWFLVLCGQCVSRYGSERAGLFRVDLHNGMVEVQHRSRAPGESRVKWVPLDSGDVVRCAHHHLFAFEGAPNAAIEGTGRGKHLNLDEWFASVRDYRRSVVIDAALDAIRLGSSYGVLLSTDDPDWSARKSVHSYRWSKVAPSVTPVHEAVKAQFESIVAPVVKAQFESLMAPVVDSVRASIRQALSRVVRP